MKFFAITGIFILFLLKLSIAQINTQAINRMVVINNSDSAIYARILIARSELKPDNSRVYYWYTPDCINVNQGGFSGYLLDGDYSVFDNKNRLIEKGMFCRGLKTGIWKRWYANGSLIKQEEWKEGLIDGVSTVYNPDGSVFRKYEYKKGKQIIINTKEKKRDKKEGEKISIDLITPADSLKTDIKRNRKNNLR